MVRRLTATLLTLILAATAGAVASTVPAHASLETSRPAVLLEVKFDEALAVRGADHGLRSQRGHSLRRVEAVLERQGATALRPFLPADAVARLTDAAAEAEARTGEPVPDLASWYTVTLPAGTDTDRVRAELTALPEIEYAEPVPDQPPPPPQPNTPDFTGMQGYFGPAWQNGIGAALTRQDPRLRGDGIKIVDLEYDWNPFHEDLQLDWSIDIGDGVFTRWEGAGADHGTAVLGQLVAVENAFGVSGGVPDADVFGISPSPPTPPGEPFPPWLPGAALAYLAARGDGQGGSFLKPGDVVLLEQQAPQVIPNSDCPTTDEWCYAPLEWIVSVHDAIQVLTSMGVNVVATGGNGHNSTEHPAYTRDGQPWFRPANNSGSILVGAGFSTNRARIDFSNHGQRFDLQGWGNAIVTTGYCHLYCVAGNDNIRYTNDFGGTSGAGPIVTTAVVAIQSYLRATGQAPWTTQQVLDLLESTGQPQGSPAPGEHIGPLPNLQAALATIEADPPATTLLLDGRPVRAGDYTNPLVTMTADDGWGSGVARVQYRLAGEQRWARYDGPFPVPGAGKQTIEYRSIDVNGNTGPVESVTLVNPGGDGGTWEVPRREVPGSAGTSH